MTDEQKTFVSLWMNQSDQFWKLIALVPVVELAILSGWYVLLKDNQLGLARSELLLGAIIMLSAALVLRRTAIYIGFFRGQIAEFLPGDGLNWLRGRTVGLFLPSLCVLLNLGLTLH